MVSGAKPFMQFCKGHYGEQFCKLVLIEDSGSGGDAVLRDFLSRALAAPLFVGAEPFVEFREEDIMRNKSVKLF